MIEPRKRLQRRQHAQLRISGMTCSACAQRVERALTSVQGVEAAHVNLASELATVEFSGDPVDLANLAEVVDDVGYAAVAVSEEHTLEQRAEWDEETQRENEALGIWLGVSALFTLPLVLPMILFWQQPVPMLPQRIQLLCAIVVQFGPGLRFYRGASSALRSASANMDVLVALGTSAAFGLSLWEWAHAGPLYFEASASVITLVLLGKWLEGGAKRQTRQALSALARMRPQIAHRLVEGQLTDVPTESVESGDLLLVRPGEQIPVDGTITQGSTSVDESLLTGESAAIDKHPGDGVTGGSINGAGALHLIATTVGGASTLSRIIRAVEEAQGQKPALVRTVDRISAVFVPAVVLLASLTLLGWWASGASPEDSILTAVAVLVIACPCALGLATPAALMVGTGMAARDGILIRDLGVLESAGAIDIAVFDKTGTLTLGRPRVTEVLTFTNAEDETEVLNLAAALQTHSEHPLARAFSEAARQARLQPPDAERVEVLVGRGLFGRVGGRSLALGSRRLMEELGIDPSPIQDQVAPQERSGAGLTYLAERDDPDEQPKREPERRVQGGRLLGVLLTQDVLRDTSRPAVDELERAGIECMMLSGDHQAVAEVIAGQAGIASVFAGVLPEEKGEMIRALRTAGHRVLMVGDGVNDAPALAEADIGVALGSGTDVAVATAPIALLRSDLGLVPRALAIATATRRKIHQNLFWAFAYNCLGIPLAMAGKLSPTLAGGAMALSSVSVLASALSLRWSRIHLRSHPERSSERSRTTDLRSVTPSTPLTPKERP